MGQDKLSRYQVRHAVLCMLAACTGFLLASNISYAPRPKIVSAPVTRIPAVVRYIEQISPVRAAIAHYIATRFHVNLKTAETITQEAYQAANAHGIKPNLVLAVAAVESSYQPRAVNSMTGARGLMQILPLWHEKQIREVGGIRALMHIKPNIDVGTEILATYLHRERGQVYAALGRYWGSLHCAGYVTRVQSQLRHLNHVAKRVRRAQGSFLMVSDMQLLTGIHRRRFQDIVE